MDRKLQKWISKLCHLMNTYGPSTLPASLSTSHEGSGTVAGAAGGGSDV